jgi:hypothetical protein
VSLDRGTLAGRPVLVVPDAEHEVVAVDDARMVFEVARHGIVELEALALGPFHESTLIGEPTGRAHEARVAVGEPVLLVDRAVRVGQFAAVDGSGLAIVALGLRTHQHPAAERTSERDANSTGVQLLPPQLLYAL